MKRISVRLFPNGPLRQQCRELLSASAEFQLTDENADVGVIDLEDRSAAECLVLARRNLPLMRRLCLAPECSDADCFAAVFLGAQGLLRCDECDTHLAPVVRQLAAGHTVFPRGALTAVPLTARFRGSRRLTPRQREVVVLRARGLSIGEIAVVCKVSDNTTKFHLREANKRLGIHSRDGLGATPHYVAAEVRPV